MEELRRKALSLGASSFDRSTRNGKKYMVQYRGRKIHFGAVGYEDYTQHRDPKRRENYRRRHRGIKLKDGTPAYLNKNQAAYWSYYLLW